MKLLDHIKIWNKWRKRNTNSQFYKFLVLVGFIHSPTMSVFKMSDYPDNCVEFVEMSDLLIEKESENNETDRC